MLKLTVPVIACSGRGSEYKCSVDRLSVLFTVPEEAFALLVLENCFKQWKWMAKVQLNAHADTTNTPSSCSVSSSTSFVQQGHSSGGYYDPADLPNEDHDDNCFTAQIGPGYKYQNTWVQRNNKPGVGPWTSQGLERYNTIVEKVIAERKVRARFEEQLLSYFTEQEMKDYLLSPKKKRKKKRSNNGNGDEESPTKVTAIDLFIDAID